MPSAMVPSGAAAGASFSYHWATENSARKLSTMWTSPLVTVLLQIALVTAGALLAHQAKPVALVLGAAAFFGAPWLAGPSALPRGLSALVGGFALLRIV